MKINKIFIQKSRTINTEGTLGRDAYRKIMVGMEAEVGEGETPIKVRNKLSKEVDDTIKEEILKIKTTQKKYKNF
jgi:hypothetical protein